MSRTHLGEALRDPAILSYSLGHFVSNVGTWMQRVGVGWLAYDLTGSAAWVGVVVACEVVPAIVLSPFGGALADRSDHVAIVRLCQGLAVLQAMLLTGLAAFDLLPILVLAGVTLMLGLIEGMAQAPRLAIISDIASGRLIPVAITLSSFGFNTARFLGPTVAGFTLVAGGPELTFLIGAATHLVFLAVLSSLHRRRRGAAPVAHGNGEGGVMAGLRHAVHHPVVAPMMLLLGSIALFARPFAEILPAIAAEFVNRSPGALAAMMASVGIGAMLGGIFMLYRTGIVPIVTVALAGPAGLVAALFAIVLFYDWPLVLYPALAATGFCMVMSGIGTQSAIHFTVDRHLRGRLLSFFGLVFRGGPALGALAIGAVGDRTGLALPLGIAAGIAGGVWLVIWSRRAAILAATEREATRQSRADRGESFREEIPLSD